MNIKKTVMSALVVAVSAVGLAVETTPTVTINEAKTVNPWDDSKGTIAVDYSLGGLDATKEYKVAFDITANGQTVSVTNDAAKLTEGAQTVKAIDTVALFGEEVTARDARVKITLIEVPPLQPGQLWRGGPIFAECNLGVTTPQDYGRSSDLYAFADTAKAVTDKLGAPWRVPTAEEFEGLTNNCTAVWTVDYNGTGTNGCLVTSKADPTKSIFLPAAGFNYGSVGSEGYYWSSTASATDPNQATAIKFRRENGIDLFYVTDTQARGLKMSIRPVKDAAAADDTVVANAKVEFRLGAEPTVMGAIPFKVQVTNDVPVVVRDQMFKFVVTPVSARDLDNTEYIMSPEEMPMPETDTISIPVSTVVDAGGLYGWGATTADNPWPITFTQPGHYTYKVVPASDSAVSFTADGDATVVVSVTENDGELVCMYSKSIAVSKMEEDDFQFTKGMNKGGAYSKEDGSVRIDIGGSDPVSGEAFDSAAIKSKFGIDFTKSFRLEGSIAIPMVPDGSAIGFVPDGTAQTVSEVLKYWCCGVFGDPDDGELGAVPCNGHGVFIEFDSWANPANQGGDDLGTFTSTEMPNTGMEGRHIMLVQTDANGKVVPGKANMVYKSEAMNISETAWPQTGTSFTIAYDKDTKDLTFTVEGFGAFVWHEPTAVFGSTTAYLVMGANVRFGPKNSFGVSDTPQATTLTMDSFRYEVAGSVDCENVLTMGVPGVHVGEHAYVMMAPNGDCAIYGTGVATNLPAGFNLDSITNLVVQDGVTEIGARFFKKCRKLNTITLGKDVVKVGEKAFYLCLSLERIVAENPAVVSSIADAVVYQTAIRPDGSLYTIPSITVPGYVEVLYGTDDLANPNWQKVDAGKTMEESGYHFFKFVLEEAK